jgi:hypothetical protein
MKREVLFSTPFSDKRAVYEIMWKNYGTARQATDDNVRLRRKYVICMTDK